MFAWVLGVTRPVLAPLGLSTACRVLDQLLGATLFGLAAGSVVALGQAMAGVGDSPRLTTIVVALVVVCLLKAALRYAEQFLGHLVAFKALELLRAEIFRALVPQAPRVLLSSRSGDLMTRATKDVDRIEIFFAHTFAPVVSAVVVPIIVLLTIGATTSWAVALWAAPFLLSAVLITPWVGARSSLAAARRSAETRARLNHHVTDSLQGMREVVGYGRADERLDEAQDFGRLLVRDSWAPTAWAALRRGANQWLMLGAAIAMVCVGLEETRGAGIDFVALAASTAAVIRLTEVVRGVEELAAAVSTSLASVERVWRTVHAPVLVEEGAEELPRCEEYDVVWENVSYRYPSAQRSALRDVNVRAAAGEWTCLVGVSGSGKTTLSQLALRFDDPAVGRVLVGGVDVRDLTNDSLRSTVGLVQQRAHLMRATVRENLKLAAPEATDEDITAACQAACIHEDILALPEGYETMIGERGASLSGGQGQRLALARMLLTQPAVLVLDEFTSHLDPALSERVRANLRGFLPRATIVEVTHKIGQVGTADRVVVLDSGQVVQAGQPAELLAVDGPLRRLAAREPEPVGT
ncbi:ABC transporter ATP-binding protein [Tessaracoccus sp. OH4464_COT-324]|nr:ABC transporter ATP-binding protein [Tessaracoccus sp. OH4464_COT-324]